MSMPGAWPEEAEKAEQAELSIETESNAYEEDENWLSRIDFRGLYVRDLSMMRKLKG